MRGWSVLHNVTWCITWLSHGLKKVQSKFVILASTNKLIYVYKWMFIVTIKLYNYDITWLTHQQMCTRAITITTVHLTVNIATTTVLQWIKWLNRLLSWMSFWFVVGHKDGDPYFPSSCPVLAVTSARQNVCLSLCFAPATKWKWKEFNRKN